MFEEPQRCIVEIGERQVGLLIRTGNHYTFHAAADEWFRFDKRRFNSIRAAMRTMEAVDEVA